MTPETGARAGDPGLTWSPGGSGWKFSVDRHGGFGVGWSGDLGRRDSPRRNVWATTKPRDGDVRVSEGWLWRWQEIPEWNSGGRWIDTGTPWDPERDPKPLPRTPMPPPLYDWRDNLDMGSGWGTD